MNRSLIFLFMKKRSDNYHVFISNIDPDNLYDNLKLLIENSELRRELGEKGRKYVEEVHDSTKIAKQLIKLYKTL